MDRQPAPSAHPRPRVWLPVGLALATVLSGTAVVTRHVGSLNDRLERSELARERQASLLGQQLEEVSAELSGIRHDVDSALGELEEAQELSARIELAEESLGSIGEAIEAHSSSLTALEETQAGFGSGIEAELEERDRRLEERYAALNELAENASRSASDSQQRLAELDKSLPVPQDLRTMWRELVGPVVQLAGDASVGSGVLLTSRRVENGYATHLVTAWHVVRDIQGDPPDLELPVPVQVYHEDGTTRQLEAKLLVHDPKLDAALLEITTPDPLRFGARLASRQRLEDMVIFDEIVAVGCPLGNDPIPTRGEIATCQHEVDGERYWMINAPTYIGNSGGGIFDSESHELIGIFSKIYTHGSLRPTIVPHMGLVTPMDKVYDWLVEVGYASVVPDGSQANEAGARSE